MEYLLSSYFPDGINKYTSFHDDLEARTLATFGLRSLQLAAPSRKFQTKRSGVDSNQPCAVLKNDMYIIRRVSLVSV